MQVQSIVFPKVKFSRAQAERWVVRHGYSVKYGVDETPATWRFRQKRPDRKKKYFAKRLKNGVLLVFF